VVVIKEKQIQAVARMNLDSGEAESVGIILRQTWPYDQKLTLFPAKMNFLLHYYTAQQYITFVLQH